MIGNIPYTTYSQFLIYVIIAISIYIVVRLLRRLTWSTILSEANALTIKEILNNFLLIYEPMIFILFLSLLVSLSIDIQTQKGIHNMSYQTLLDNGYTLSQGDKISRLYVIQMTKSESQSLSKTELLDRLANTPYIDWNTSPEIEINGVNKDQVSLRVVLRNKSHLDEVISLLHTWKYIAINVKN